MAQKPFTTENQPKNRKTRGPSPKTHILNALKRQGKDEDGFWDLLVARALDPEDSFAMKELLGRIAPLTKATLPTIEFDFDIKSSPANQVSQLIDAASSGLMAPDVATTFIQAIKASVDIEVSTDLKKRIEEIEKAMGVDNV